MYFVLNVNACIVHFSHENESLRAIQLGPVTAELTAKVRSTLQRSVLRGETPES